MRGTGAAADFQLLLSKSAPATPDDGILRELDGMVTRHIL
jgi:hypothetical protein